MEKISVSIRNLQHYLYCPHRWGMININCSWAENYYVTKGNLMHNRVHDENNSYTSRNKRVLVSVPVYNDQLGIYGVADCIELKSDSNGVEVGGYDGKYKLSIVEYKPKQPSGASYNTEDALQVFAQKVCVDSIFNCDCDGIIYYGNVKKRVLLPLRSEYEYFINELNNTLSEIRKNTYAGVIPPIRRGQKCNGCSFRDICIPQFGKSRKKVTFMDFLRESEKDGDTT